MLLSLIGVLLPIAVGVAISPTGMIAQLLILTAERWRANALAFLAGAFSGLTTLTVAVGLLTADAVPVTRGHTSPIVATVTLILGVVMLWLSGRQWRSRPRPGRPGTDPRWMSGIATLSPPGAFGLGAVLTVVNAKTIPLTVSAAAAIGDADVAVGAAAAAVIVYAVVGVAGVALPLILRGAIGDRADPPLRHASDALVQNAAVITAVVFLVLGGNLVGKGLSGLA